RYDKRRLVAIFLGAGAIAVIPVLLSQSLLWFGIFYSLMFLMLGGTDPLIMSYSLTLVPDNKKGLLFGIRASVGSIAWAIAPLIGSYVSINHSLEAVFYLIPVFLVFALTTTLILMKKRTRSPLSV
ncbi:MAG TPA: MFS transporter, partial [Clostridia bacterium]|nr:MFS transporter [Clostridia bacterium]